jgi:hypothetical protein
MYIESKIFDIRYRFSMKKWTLRAKAADGDAVCRGVSHDKNFISYVQMGIGPSFGI